ncbi:hypothetical protein D779_1334 [Imhoffiella purpurea]|uniref:Uncharacterized protein n=1 Tax=Imhoffiella purpurea TaxID=1249627 RepID=W9VHR8_9GAMM|nr:hypothetical protein D779_1334 [Imhoffiella purpurea]
MPVDRDTVLATSVMGAEPLEDPETESPGTSTTDSNSNV